MARGRLMSLCRRWSQFTAGLSTAARKRAITNQPTKVLTCQSKKNAPSHGRGQEGYSHRAHHLSRRGACPPTILAWHGGVGVRGCGFGVRLWLCLRVPLWVLFLVRVLTLRYGRVGYLHPLKDFPWGTFHARTS